MSDLPDVLHRTRAGYDATAEAYADWLRDDLYSRPWELHALAEFAVLAGDSGEVADIGCGPGRITAHLHDLGCTAFGIDLSPAMIALARNAYPCLRFEVGSMTDLNLPDNSLAGIVAWYSIIHLPPELLPDVFAAFRRALRPDGVVLLAFQVGDEPRRLTEAFGTAVDLTFHRLPPDRITTLLTETGFTAHSTRIHHPEPGTATTLTPAPAAIPQAFLIARAG